MENFTVKEGKTMAIISYITWVGTLIAFVMNNEKHISFAAFHIRHKIGLSLFSLGISIIARYTGSVAGILAIGLFVLWIIGLMDAINSEEKKVPFVGDLFQDWFKVIG